MIEHGHGHSDDFAHERDAAHVHERQAEAATVREPFSVAQLISLTLGILYLVLGAVGLARSGFDDLAGDTAHVGPFTMTALLALLHLLLGILGLAGATGRSAARSMLVALGPILIAVGIIALIQPIQALGWNDPDGWLYLITGVSALAAAIATPVATVYERRSRTL